MKHFLTSLICALSIFVVNAQQYRFIYLQTENKQPFFVKLNNKVLNSYPLGYLIIPKLDDGIYSLVIGFPGSNYEMEFNCSIKNKDVGFMIKNVAEKQWQLLNVQTFNVIIPGDVITQPFTAYEKETDPFSTMLANAVNDSTILRKDIAKENNSEKSTGPIQKDTANSVALNSDVVIAKQDTSFIANSSKKDIVKETLPEIPKQVDQKNTTQKIISNNEVTVSKHDNTSVSDSTKTDIIKEILSKKPDEINQKDTVNAIVTNTGGILSKPDSTLISKSGKKDIVAETPPDKSNELNQKDTVQTIIPYEVLVAKSQKKKPEKDDRALQDSSVVEKEIIKIIPEKIGANKDTVQHTNSNNEKTLLRSVIKRRLKKNNKDGIEMIYIDDYGDATDTIRILIPSDKTVKKVEEVKITEPNVSSPTIQNPSKQIDLPNETNKTDSKILEKEKEIPKESNKEPLLKSVMINSDCKKFSTDEDFLKLRKKMVTEKNDEGMIKVAKKNFKTKCFTTEQIKNLSVLFIKDDGKYMFFDTAYPFVSDSDLYPALEKQLSDIYYITRFRAMIHK